MELAPADAVPAPDRPDIQQIRGDGFAGFVGQVNFALLALATDTVVVVLSDS